MTSYYNFDSNLVEVTNFDSIIVTDNNFDSIIIPDISYNIIIQGFLETESLFLKFVQDNIITIAFLSSDISMSLNFDQSLTMVIDNDLIGIETGLNIGFEQNNTVSMSFGLATSIEDIYFTNSNIISINLAQNIGMGDLSIENGDVDITFDITQIKYYMLSDWDGYLLSDLDTMNLEDLDYQEIT